jgi:hypothetical protein
LRSDREEPDFFLYDIVRQDGKEIAFKAVQERAEVNFDSKGPFADLFAAMASLLQQDTKVNVVEGIKLTARSGE